MPTIRLAVAIASLAAVNAPRAEPYRPLPRLPPSEVQKRADGPQPDFTPPTPAPDGAPAAAAPAAQA
ncbi:MAG TPA: serine/threonine protein kinase, partial [Anaeromyxobacteraceae bacterium]|nr:serine/threonine protein kinase [Anaeromyxobacteraceae bacterium]